MTRTEFKDKHNDAIMNIKGASPTPCDRDEATDKLISTIRAKKEGGEFEVYPGIPEDFDFDAAYADYQELTRE